MPIHLDPNIRPAYRAEEGYQAPSPKPIFAPVEKPKTHVLGNSFGAVRSTGRAAVDIRTRLLAPKILAPHDFPGLLGRLEKLRQPGVELRTLGHVDGHPIPWVHLPALVQPPKLRVLVTGGVHGKEGAGPAAALLWLEQVLAEPQLRREVEFTVIPCVCPTGYVNRTRKNGGGVNLNRLFGDGLAVPPEVAVVRGALTERPYDLAIDLHASKSAGREGFFVLHRGAEEPAKAALSQFSKKHPVLDRATELYAQEAPGLYRSQNHGTLKDYLGEHGVPYSYTVESPALLEYEKQVVGLADLIRSLRDAALNLRSGP